MITNGSDPDKIMDGHNSHYTSSPTTISFAPYESVTLSAYNNPNSQEKRSAINVPNITVPAEHKNRTLILCFDGTGDQFDADNSNIVEFFSILRKDDPEKQLVYYQAGIGTYTVPQIVTPGFAKFSKMMDQAIAWNLDAHIMGGYEFLMQNCEPVILAISHADDSLREDKAGDKICILGFSRGAYTACCLAGMIHKVGLLPICNHQQVPFAYKMYTHTNDLGWKQSNAFKNSFSINVQVDFLGVWDTVNSVGLIPRRLPFTMSNTNVRIFRHAVSLDERRAKFKQNHWNHPSEKESKLAHTDRPGHEHYGNHSQHKHSQKHQQKHLERQYSVIPDSPTNVEEVWFAGCHCDIGGGSVANGVRPNLARIPLRWMIRQTFLTETGIMFSARGLQKLGLDLDPDTYHPVLKRPPALEIPPNTYIQPIPRSERLPIDKYEEKIREDANAEAGLSEQEIDLRDALSPKWDQLRLSRWWWILELLPLRHRFQKDDKSWTSYLGFNMGKGRHIPKQKKHGVKVHRTVKTRMDASYANGKKYVPKANLKVGKVIWVD